MRIPGGNYYEATNSIGQQLDEECRALLRKLARLLKITGVISNAFVGYRGLGTTDPVVQSYIRHVVCRTFGFSKPGEFILVKDMVEGRPNNAERVGSRRTVQRAANVLLKEELIFMSVSEQGSAVIIYPNPLKLFDISAKAVKAWDGGKTNDEKDAVTLVKEIERGRSKLKAMAGAISRLGNVTFKDAKELKRRGGQIVANTMAFLAESEGFLATERKDKIGRARARMAEQGEQCPSLFLVWTNKKGEKKLKGNGLYGIELWNAEVAKFDEYSQSENSNVTRGKMANLIIELHDQGVSEAGVKRKIKWVVGSWNLVKLKKIIRRRGNGRVVIPASPDFEFFYNNRRELMHEIGVITGKGRAYLVNDDNWLAANE